jgi:hypothetical protein
VSAPQAVSMTGMKAASRARLIEFRFIKVSVASGSEDDHGNR